MVSSGVNDHQVKVKMTRMPNAEWQLQMQTLHSQGSLGKNGNTCLTLPIPNSIHGTCFA